MLTITQVPEKGALQISSPAKSIIVANPFDQYKNGQTSQIIYNKLRNIFNRAGIRFNFQTRTYYTSTQAKLYIEKNKNVIDISCYPFNNSEYAHNIIELSEIDGKDISGFFEILTECEIPFQKSIHSMSHY